MQQDIHNKILQWFKHPITLYCMSQYICVFTHIWFKLHWQLHWYISLSIFYPSGKVQPLLDACKWTKDKMKFSKDLTNLNLRGWARVSTRGALKQCNWWLTIISNPIVTWPFKIKACDNFSNATKQSDKQSLSKPALKCVSLT